MLKRRFTGLLDQLISPQARSDFASGFRRTSGQGYEDDRRAVSYAMDDKGEDFSNMTSGGVRGSTYPLMYRFKDQVDRLPDEGNLGKVKQFIQGNERFGRQDDDFRAARDHMDLNFKPGQASRATRAGEWIGTAVNDFNSNRTREWWWWLNAMPATLDAAGDSVLRKAAPHLFKETPVRVGGDNSSFVTGLQEARDKGLVNPAYGDRPYRGVSKRVAQIPFANTSEGSVRLPEDDIEFIGQRIRRNGNGHVYHWEDLTVDGKTVRKRVPRINEETGEPEVFLGPNERITAEKVARLTPEEREYLNDDLRAHPYYRKRNTEPGHLNSLMLPAQTAMTVGIGLSPLAVEGYNAVFPSQEDPQKTDNLLAEIGAKYIMGRSGRLLPWEEFSLVRPDVSKSEYMAYQGFKQDKKLDLNPFDGDITLPLGALKATNEGIHGPEVQFLGRSLPATTGVIPTAAALAATAFGARYGGIRGGLLAGAAGLGSGLIGGNMLEQERRRRNFQENNPGYPVPYSKFRENAAELREKMLEGRANNPQLQDIKEDNKTTFGFRAKQGALVQQAQEQGALIDQLLQGEKRRRAEAAMAAQMGALQKADALQMNARDPGPAFQQIYPELGMDPFAV